MNNPDLIHDVYLSAIPTTAAVGQLAEARRLARELDEFVQTLTPHHKVHGVGVRVELEELQADWAAAAALEERIVATVRNNQDTPCIRNPRSLLVCALADEIMGSTRRARELEAEAAEYMYEGFGATLAAPRARMALVRGSVDALEELLADDEWLQRQTWFALPAAAARLDAFAAIGSADETRAAAERLGSGSPYLEPFALRAVGVASGHDALVERADVAFRALSLDWHREQTEPLRRLRKVALG